MTADLDLDEWITTRLKKLDRNASWLAKQIGREPSTIARWRSGESKPGNYEDIIKLADILKIDSPEDRASFFRLMGIDLAKTVVSKDELGSTSSGGRTVNRPILPLPDVPKKSKYRWLLIDLGFLIGITFIIWFVAQLFQWLMNPL